VPLAADYSPRAPLRFLLKGRLDCDASARMHAHVLAGQESFRILPLLESNAWIVIPETIGTVAAGTLVDVHGLGHLQAPAPIPA